MSQVGQKLEHRISAGQADHDSRHHFPLTSSYRQQFRGARNQNRANKVLAGMELQHENYFAAILAGLLPGPAFAAQSLGDRVASNPAQADIAQQGTCQTFT